MFYYRELLAGLFIFFTLSACNEGNMQNPDNADHSVQYKTMEWTDLMPASDLETLLNPPDYVNEISEGSLAEVWGQSNNPLEFGQLS